LPETIPIVVATFPATVVATYVASASHGRGRPKKVVVPGSVKPKKELTPKERSLESKKIAKRQVNVRTKLVAAHLPP
jgi:hypothetical protein